VLEAYQRRANCVLGVFAGALRRGWTSEAMPHITARTWVRAGRNLPAEVSHV